MEAPGRNDTGGVVDDDHDGLTEMEWLEREQEKEMIQLAMERSLNEFHHVQQPIMDSDYYQRQQQQQPMANRDFSFSQDRQAMHQQNEAMEPDIFHDRRHSYNNNNNNNNSNNNNNNPSRDDHFSSGTSGMHHHPTFERDPYQPHPSRDDNRFSPRQDAIRRRDPSANHNQWPEFPANQYTSRDRFDTARHNMGGSMRNLGSGRDVHNNNRSSYQRGGSFRAIEEVTETVIDSPHHHHPSYDRVNEHRGASNYNSHLHHDEWISPEPFNDYRESSQAPYHRQTPPSDYGRRTPPRDGRRTPPRYQEPAQQLPPVVRERNHMTPNMMTPRDQARDAVLQTARQHLSAEEAELVDQALRLGRTAPADIVQPNSEGRLSSHSMPHVAGTRRLESSSYGVARPGQHRSRSFDDMPTPEERRQWESNSHQPPALAAQITMDLLGRAQASEHLSQQELDGIEQALIIQNSSQDRQGRDCNHLHPQNQHHQPAGSRDHRRNTSIDSMAIAKAEIQQAMAEKRLTQEEATELMHAFEAKNTDENAILLAGPEQHQPLQERLFLERAWSPSSATNISSALLDTGELRQQQHQTQSDDAMEGEQSMQQVSDADLPRALVDHASRSASTQEEEEVGEGEETANSIVQDLPGVVTEEVKLENSPPKSGEGEEATVEELKHCSVDQNTGEDGVLLSEKGREQELAIVAPISQPIIAEKQSNEMTTSSHDDGSHHMDPSKYTLPVGECNTSSSSATKANHEGSATSPTALQSGGENSYIHGSSLSAEAIPDEEQSTSPSGDCNVEVATDTTLITDSDQSRNSNSQEGAHAPKAAVTDETKNNVESTETEGASGAASGHSGTEERQVCSERTDVDQPSIESTGIIEQLAVAKIAGDLSPSELESSAGVDLNALSAYLDTLSAENKSDDGSTILPVAIPLATSTAAPRYAPGESQATPLDPPDEDQLPAIYNRDNSHTGAMDDHSGAPYSERRALDVRVAPDAQDYAFDQQHGQQEWRDNTGNGPNAGEFFANYDRRFREPAQQHPRDFRRGSHVPQPDFDRWSDNYGLDRGAVQNAPEASQQPRMTRGDNRQSFVSDFPDRERHQYSSVEQAGPNHQVDGGGAGQPWDTAHRQPDRAGVPAQVTDPRDSRETWVSSNNSVSSLGESTQFSLFSGHLPYQKQGSFRNSENYDRALSEHNNWRQSNPTPMTHSILETSGHRQEPNHPNSDHANSSWQHQQLSSPQLSYPGVSGAERGQRIGRDCEEHLVSFNRAGNSGSRTPPILYSQERNHGRIIDKPSDYIKGRDRLANRESFNGQAVECDQERDRVAGHDSFVGGRAHENVESYSQELRASDHDRFDAELKRALFESIQMQQTPLAETGCEQDPPYTQSFPPEALLSQEQLDHINRALAAPVEDEQTPRSSSYDEFERSRLSSAGTTILENERLATRSASFPPNQADELPHFPAVTAADFECALQEAKDEEERQSLLLARQLQEEDERRLPGLPKNRASLSPGSQAIDSAIGQDSTFSSVTPRRTSQVGAVRSSSPARAQHPLESSFASLPPQRASARNLASTHRDRQPMEDSFASLPRPQLEGSSQANERSRQSLGNSSNSAREEQPPEHTRRPIRDASSSELVTSGTPEQGQPSIPKDTVSEKKSRRDSKVLGSVAKLGKKGVGSLLQTMKRSSVRRVSLTAGGSADQDEGATETASSDLTTETLLQIDRAVVKGVICKLNGTVKMGNEATLFHADGGPESDGFDVAVKVYKRALGLGGSNQERTGKDLSQFRNISSSEQLELWTIKEYRNLKRARKAGVPAPAALMARQNILFMHFVGENGVPAPQLGQLELRRGHKRWKALYKQIIEAIWRQVVHCRNLPRSERWWHFSNTFLCLSCSQAIQ